MRYPAILATAAALLGAATVLAAPAAAAEAEGAVSVRYSDLDLSTKAGQDRLERRIDNAAREACGMDKIPTGSHMPTLASRRCYTETKAQVHDQVAEAIARGNSRG